MFQVQGLLGINIALFHYREVFKVSDKNRVFDFLPEEQFSVQTHNKKIDILLLSTKIFVGVITIFLLCVFTLNKETDSAPSIVSKTRTLSSIQKTGSTEIIPLNPLFIRIKGHNGFRLTKINMTLEISGSQSEVQNSIHSIRDHLIFILSSQKDNVFSDAEKKKTLKQEIINQLNLFLSKDHIEKVELNEKFLS